MLSLLWKSPDSKGLQDQSPEPPAPLASTWEVRTAAGEPIAAVRVRNLQGAIPVGRDAWGRPNKSQPVLLSSEVSFARPFTSASADDAVNTETVHYGTLSKTLLGTLDLWNNSQPPSAAGAKAAASLTSGDVFELLWVRMTGRVVDGSRRELPLDQVPFLSAARLRALTLTLHLPKASLLGVGGVSLSTTARFRPCDGSEGDDDDKKKNPLAAYSRTLRISGLHVPTLIGVNDNERRAKQMVVADVEIDRFDTPEDIYSELEKMVVEAMEASSFETLEALATHLAQKILTDFRLGDDPNKTMCQRGWQVRICLEKPIAVPFADCPAVEVKMGAGLP